MLSNFQFSDPILSKIDFRLNELFDADAKNEVSIQTHVETKVSRKKDASEAIVRMEVTIGLPDEQTPFYLQAEEMARFRWSEDEYTEEEINTLLSQNAPALLLSYIRPIVSSVTNSSAIGVYNIPFINFTKKCE